MTVKLRKSFIKEFNRLDQRQKLAWFKTLELFRESKNHPKLRRHKLKGKYEGMESLDILPDLRALFVVH